MTHATTTISQPGDTTARSVLERLARLALCAAFIQGPIAKIADFPGAIAEMEHFGLRPPALFAACVIVFELVCSAMIVSGVKRRPAALALAAFTLAATFLALRFWEMEPGMARQMAANAFFEHIGLVGAFALVASPGRQDRKAGEDHP
ncbi:DoxX family protein [Mangrovicella endophytica]|uniref:DoxX family protein n=1 Tax=Mangrovicella endophytica TaxID=2066697 RepID=UPI000C9EC060|nr:DoxX family protein [Mangrovicella endophytica]